MTEGQEQTGLRKIASGKFGVMPDFATAKERQAWQQAKWRSEHQSHIKAKLMSRHPWERHFNHIQKRCAPSGEYTQRGIHCRLTMEGIKRLWYRDKGWLLKRPSVDRIDNAKGYSFGNCRFIELIDNIKKGGK